MDGVTIFLIAVAAAYAVYIGIMAYVLYRVFRDD